MKITGGLQTAANGVLHVALHRRCAASPASRASITLFSLVFAFTLTPIDRLLERAARLERREQDLPWIGKSGKDFLAATPARLVRGFEVFFLEFLHEVQEVREEPLGRLGRFYVLW